MSYTVSLSRTAEKGLAGLAKDVAQRVLEELDRLAADPRPPGCKKLVGGDGDLRVRVGDYRILYVVDDKARTVMVQEIAHRREAYR